FFGAVEAAETPSAFGIAVHYFAEVGDLVATPAPYKRSASDPCGPLLFQETLDLPKLRGIDEATPTPRDWPKGSRQFVDELDPGSRCHVLGHAEPAMGETLAEANKWVHLMHPWAVFGRWREQPNVQVRPADLKARKFHKVRLVWPDGMFDL
ncbi:MAG TPA: hypothetical protein VGE52_02125, partial [Pirellulales bacterium]